MTEETWTCDGCKTQFDGAPVNKCPTCGAVNGDVPPPSVNKHRRVVVGIQTIREKDRRWDCPSCETEFQGSPSKRCPICHTVINRKAVEVRHVDPNAMYDPEGTRKELSTLAAEHVELLEDYEKASGDLVKLDAKMADLEDQVERQQQVIKELNEALAAATGINPATAPAPA